MDLSEVRDLVVEELEGGLAMLTAGYPMSESGQDFRDVSGLFQALAICQLMAKGDAEKYRRNLVCSGHARRHYLRKSREQKNEEDRFLGLSRSEAILDALVAGDMQLAREIAELSTETWNPTWEYEDDYCFYLFIHTLIQSADQDPSRSRLDTILDQFEAALEGDASPHLEVCRALVSRDEDDFVDALQSLIAWREEQLDAKRPSITPPDFLFWPASFVYIEALALLRCAEIVGIQLRGEFSLCPSESRLGVRVNDYHDHFAELDTIL